MDIIVSVFGCELYFYVIMDVIRDEKVFKFKVDYNDVWLKFKGIEIELDEKKLMVVENKIVLLYFIWIKEILEYIL